MDDQQTTGTSGRKRFRKLRIAWSVVWGIVCLLLIVMWVRSYKFIDNASLVFPSSHRYQVSSTDGRLLFFYSWNQTEPDFLGPSWFTYDSSMKGYFPERRNFIGFGLERIGNNTVLLTCPHWFATIVFAGLAALPGFGWRRFSLRTMLIVLTLAAVGLGWFVYALRN